MNEIMDFNKHYICIDLENNIIDGWSDGPLQQKNTDEAICITEHGGYQFRLFPNGEENSHLMDENGVCLYRYIGGEVIAKTPEEIQAETPEPPPSLPTLEDQIKALSAAVMEMAGELYG